MASAVNEGNMSGHKGYSASILLDNTLISQLICHLCEMLLRQPSQVECGHQFCEMCLKERLQSVAEIKCCVCETEGDNTTITVSNFQPDFACRKRMKKMKVRCENHGRGCTWQDVLRNLDEHLESCPYALIECSACRQKVQRSALDDHREAECMGGSEEVTGPCQFGCVDLPPDVDIEQHNQENVALHLNLVLQAYDGLERLRIILNRMVERVQALPYAQAEGDSVPAAPPTVDVQQVPVDGEMHIAVENLKKMDVATKTSTNLINLAFKEVQRVASRLVELERVFQAQFVGSGNGDLPERQQEIQQLSKQLSDQNVSHCGVLLWEIDGVDQKIEQAQAAQHVSIDSTAFFTGQVGYKLKSRIYLNGDGSGAGTYISLFIVVMKGPYDGTLKWPLSQFVRFTLFDQSGRRDHVNYSFCTDPQSSSFRRPQSETNIASGCPQFASLTDFRRRYQDFVVDNKVVIEVRMENEGLA